MLPLHIANIIIISHLKNFSCCFSNKFTSLWQKPWKWRAFREFPDFGAMMRIWILSFLMSQARHSKKCVSLSTRRLHDFATGVNGRCWELVGSTLSRYLFWIDIACNLPCRHLRYNICAVFRLRLVDEEFMVAYWLLVSLNFSRGMASASATTRINVFSFL